MNYITQGRLDALAAAANQVLLPLVNESLALPLGGYANPYYDKMSGLPLNAPTPVDPQPAYSFAAVPYQNLVPAGSRYDADGNFWITLPWSGDYNYQQGANDLSLYDPANGGSDYLVSTSNFYLLQTADAVTLTGTPGQPVTAVLTESPSALLKELNRIRGDLMTLVLGDNPLTTTPLYLNPGAVCSGPWVVGVNEPQTWPVANLPLNFTGALPAVGAGQGYLPAGLAMDGSQAGSFCIFDEVEFVSLTANGTINSMLMVNTTFPTVNVWTNSPPGYWGGFTCTLKIVSTMEGNVSLNVGMTFGINNAIAETPAPPVSAVGFSVSPSFGTLTLTDPTDTGNALYQFTGTYNGYLLAGEKDIVFTFKVPTGWGVLLDGGATWSPGWANISAATVTGWVGQWTADAISMAVVTPAAEAPLSTTWAWKSVSLNGQSCYLDNGSSQFYFYPAFQMSPPDAPGVWVARTLPVPGINVFIDQDIPPHIGGLATVMYQGNPLTVAVSGAGQMDGTRAAPYASAMRQAVPVQTGLAGGLDLTVIDKVRAAKPGITTRPAKWLVRRDSDFVPFDLGFNNAYGNYTSTTYPDQVLGPAGMTYFSVPVPPNATTVRIQLVKPGTVPGWQGVSGAASVPFSYGQPVGSSLNIYVRQTGTPALPADYDFMATGNYVTINGTVASGSNWWHVNGTTGIDISAGYLAAVRGNGFAFAVRNPGAAVAFDVYVQIETGTPTRIYTPPCGECYSYCLDGTPGMYFNAGAMWYGGSSVKPIPQSGYCLFKARATRLPVAGAGGIRVTPPTGAQCTVTLGQNVQNSDGSLTFVPLMSSATGLQLMLTIPATAGTSDDVPLFIPVLAGNEVVYQCSEQVILEVWANWQPLWFNKVYQLGEYPYAGDPSVTVQAQWPAVTAFRTALSFVNDFNALLPGWAPPYYNPDPGSVYNLATGSAAVWPLFGELYNDLAALLAVLGASLPTLGSSQDAGGAGGAGSAGQVGGDAPGGAGGLGGYGAL